MTKTILFLIAYLAIGFFIVRWYCLYDSINGEFRVEGDDIAPVVLAVLFWPFCVFVGLMCLAAYPFEKWFERRKGIWFTWKKRKPKTPNPTD